MATIAERVKTFQELTFEEKKHKVILMLEGLKDSAQVFAELLGSVQNKPNIDDAMLVEIYQGILEFAEAVNESEKEQSLDKLSVMQEKIRKIHEMEAADRANEHPEDILNQI